MQTAGCATQVGPQRRNVVSKPNRSILPKHKKASAHRMKDVYPFSWQLVTLEVTLLQTHKNLAGF